LDEKFWKKEEAASAKALECELENWGERYIVFVWLIQRTFNQKLFSMENDVTPYIVM